MRELLLENFKNGDDYDFFFFFNVRCLSEGVNIPSLHSIVYIDPKSSFEQIYQSLGRVIRKSPNKDFGNVYIPILIDSEELENKYKNDLCSYLASSKRYRKEGHNFKRLLKILIALASDSSILKDLAILYKNDLEDYSQIIQEFTKTLNVEFLSSKEMFIKLDNSAIWKTIFNSNEFTKGQFSRDLKVSAIASELFRNNEKFGIKHNICISNLEKISVKNEKIKKTAKEIYRSYKKGIKDNLVVHFLNFLKRDGRIFK